MTPFCWLKTCYLCACTVSHESVGRQPVVHWVPSAPVGSPSRSPSCTWHSTSSHIHPSSAQWSCTWGNSWPPQFAAWSVRVSNTFLVSDLMLGSSVLHLKPCVTFHFSDISFNFIYISDWPHSSKNQTLSVFTLPCNGNQNINFYWELRLRHGFRVHVSCVGSEKGCVSFQGALTLSISVVCLAATSFWALMRRSSWYCWQFMSLWMA